MKKIKYHKSWKKLFKLYDFNLDGLYDSDDNKKIIYPPEDKVFKVFELPVDEIRVVLLGQDPYHNPGQAHGLSFSVPDGIKPPPSLLNIYKELENEYPELKFNIENGNLEKWFEREKIFLLNASLTVEKNKAGSNMEIWREFTDDVIKYISENNKKCVFLLLGNFAKNKSTFIEDKERIVTGIHPSPLSANNGFFNSGIFKRVEKVLGEKIDWSL